ncbi:MAG: hypothetical protein U0Y68_12005 [Blastocatellia bacterium]
MRSPYKAVVLTGGVDNTIMDADEYAGKHDYRVCPHCRRENGLIYPMYLDTEYEMVTKRKQQSGLPTLRYCAQTTLVKVAEQSGGLLFPSPISKTSTAFIIAWLPN